MKLLKFGTITGNEQGGLTFSGFEVDCENDPASPNEVLILLALDRIQRVLEEVRGSKTVGGVRG